MLCPSEGQHQQPSAGCDVSTVHFHFMPAVCSRGVPLGHVFYILQSLFLCMRLREALSTSHHAQVCTLAPWRDCPVCVCVFKGSQCSERFDFATFIFNRLHLFCGSKRYYSCCMTVKLMCPLSTVERRRLPCSGSLPTAASPVSPNGCAII